MDICTRKGKVASQKQLELACSNHGIVSHQIGDELITTLHIKKERGQKDD